MNAEKRQLIKNLLNSFGQKCNYMTHNLAELGDGDMAEGLVTLYQSGQLNGVIIGAGSVAALVTIYHVGNAIIEGISIKNAIRQTAKEQEAQRKNVVKKVDTIPPTPPDPSDVETAPATLPTDTLHNSDLSSIS